MTIEGGASFVPSHCLKERANNVYFNSLGEKMVKLLVREKESIQEAVRRFRNHLKPTAALACEPRDVRSVTECWPIAVKSVLATKHSGA